MYENIENLTSPPIIGKVYLVPCIEGVIASVGFRSARRLWPVFRPSHEDSKYIRQTTVTFWRETENGFEEFEENGFLIEAEPFHHHHIDPRFCPDEYFTSWERENHDYHNFIDFYGQVEWKELICVREMPPQRLFTGFGKQFVDDHAGKKTKCLRCPHKGTLLNSMPVVDGVRTCPAHGLKFDDEGKCITVWE